MDYVVCAHKAIDQDEVAAQLTPVVDPSRTTIVVIQNGVGNEEPFRKQFPQNSIITCVVSIPHAIGDVWTRLTAADMGGSHANQPRRRQAH